MHMFVCSIRIRIAWVMCALVLSSPLARALEIVDDRGIRVTLTQVPQRIVSVLPSLSETVCALGRCASLVGVDRYSNFPDTVRRLPKVGGGLDPNIEAIVALRPDLVLLATSSPAAARLESLGLKVVALEPKRHADAERVMLQLGQLLDVPDAPRLWAGIQASVDAAARSLPTSARGKRVYFEVNSGPYAASASSFIGETLTRLGVANIVPGDMGPFPKINPEFVVRADPDLIMVGDANFAGMQQRPGWSRMRAIRAGRVCVFAPQQADVMVRSGPAHGRGGAGHGAVSGAASAMNAMALVLQHRRHQARRVIGGLLAVSMLLLLLGLAIGSTGLENLWDARGDALSLQIIRDIRAPRALGAWLAGALLGLAGAIAQGLFRNPLADPYLLGSASGASFGVGVALVLMGTTPYATDWLARLGLTSAAFVGAVGCGAADPGAGARRAAYLAPAARRRGGRRGAGRARARW